MLYASVNEINESIDYIDNKQKLFDGILAGEIKYTSNLIVLDE
jgi:hypothetical protein